MYSNSLERWSSQPRDLWVVALVISAERPLVLLVTIVYVVTNQPKETCEVVEVTLDGEDLLPCTEHDVSPSAQDLL